MNKAKATSPPDQVQAVRLGRYIRDGGRWWDPEFRDGVGDPLALASLELSPQVALDEAVAQSSDFFEIDPFDEGTVYRVVRHEDGSFELFWLREPRQTCGRSNGRKSGTVGGDEGGGGAPELQPDPERTTTPVREHESEPAAGGESKEPETRSLQETIFRQHTLARSSEYDHLTGADKLVAQTVGLAMPGDAGPAFPSMRRLAEWTGLSCPGGIHRCVNRLVEGGVLRRDPVPDRAREGFILDVWAPPELRSEVVRMWTAGTERYPSCVYRHHDERLHYGYQLKKIGFIWIRAVRGSDLPPPARGICHAVRLLVNNAGCSFRPTTSGELARWSGYSDRTVRRYLRRLSDEDSEWGRWLHVERPDGDPRVTRQVQLWPLFPVGAEDMVGRGVWTYRDATTRPLHS